MANEINPFEEQLIYHLSGDIGTSLTPFSDLATTLGVSETEVLSCINDFQAKGILRRFGATLRHQLSGFAANAMFVFEISNDKIDDCGLAFAALPYISHCYCRRTAPGWPFNLYAMAHAESRTQLLAIASEMVEISGGAHFRMLESQREFKKTSLRFFA
ncbi:MAG: Lrp/AsnC family transcriptional regulator [Candidatus Adiutrix sp.]